MCKLLSIFPCEWFNMPDVSFIEENKKIFESEMAYNILHIFFKENKQLYSKEITEKLNQLNIETSNKSVSNYIKQLREIGVLKRGKRTQAQYYKLDYDSIFELWVNYVNYRMEMLFSSNEGLRMEADDVVNQLMEELEGNEKEFAPENREEVDKEAIRDVLEDSIEGFSDNVQAKKEEFNSITKENKKLRHFFLSYCNQVFQQPFLRLHDVFVRLLFRELLLLSWGKDEIHDDFNVLIKALSGCQIGESGLVGSGKIAYERSYEEN